MIITIYAFTANRARLLEKQATISNDEALACMIADRWKREGFEVKAEVEK